MRVTTVDGSTTRELRRSVLRSNQSPDDVMPGDDRPDAIHVAALADDGALLGTCLVFAQDCDWRPERPAWILRSMAVEPAAQGGGIGTTVLAHAVDLAGTCGAALLWCHARGTAAGFWLRAGFHDRYPDARSYVEPETGLVHRDMWRPVP